jgi:hypothetical protein
MSEETKKIVKKSKAMAEIMATIKAVNHTIRNIPPFGLR